MPVKLGLELMPVVGANGMDTKRKLADEVVDERDGILLIMPLVDFERADPSGVVDGRVLVAPHALA